MGLEKDPGAYDLAYNLALVYSRNGDASSTVKVLEGILNPPPDSDYYRLLGASYGAMDKPEKAVELLRRSVTLDRKNEHAQYDLGMVLVTQKRDQEAVAVFEEAVKYCPGSSKVQTGLGLSYYLTGNNKAAETAFLKGVKLDPSSPAAYGDLAEFYMALGNLDQALAVYDKVVRIEPKDAGLRYKYAVALDRRNRDQEAADQLVQALGSDANHAQSLGLLGRIRLSQGKPQEAVALLEKAVAALPGERETRYSLIRAYQAVGARDKADRQVEILRSLPATPAKSAAYREVYWRSKLPHSKAAFGVRKLACALCCGSLLPRPEITFYWDIHNRIWRSIARQSLTRKTIGTQNDVQR